MPGRAATAHRGFVVSYMGDGAMMVFGLPAPQPGDAGNALAAVAQLHRSITEWLQTLPLPAAVLGSQAGLRGSVL